MAACIVAFFEIHPIADAIQQTGASRNTLEQYLRQLVERGHPSRHGRGVWYALR